MNPIEVLMVEDNRGDVVLIETAIERVGLPYHVTVVSDGVEAVEFLHRRGKYAQSPRPELITLDLKLPRKNGCEVLEEIRPDALLARYSPGAAEQFHLGAEACAVLRTAAGMLPGKARQLSGLCRVGPVHRGLPPQGREREAAMTAGRKRILLVEDNRADAVLLQEMLARDARGQFELAWTSSLRETLDRIAGESFDAVLLDLSLPDSHGLETISRLCRRRAGDADCGDHGADGRANRHRGRPLRRGGLPGQRAERTPGRWAGRSAMPWTASTRRPPCAKPRPPRRPPARPRASSWPA